MNGKKTSHSGTFRFRTPMWQQRYKHFPVALMPQGASDESQPGTGTDSLAPGWLRMAIHVRRIVLLRRAIQPK